MKKIKVGQIGIGGFGKKILSKLENISDVSVEWVYGSKDKWWEPVDVDWVIIASPNEFHYEQAKHFLTNGVNVFFMCLVFSYQRQTLCSAGTSCGYVTRRN